MYYQTLTYPGIFEIVKNNDNKDFFLRYKEYLYKTPKKLYGGMEDYINFYWKSFERDKYVGGLLLTGQKGSGKTVISSVLCNKAIARGLRVVEIVNIRYSPELLKFLDSLDNVVLFFDEFGKNFTTREQDKMLTLLSNINGKERLVFITENNPDRISEFIRNRPGRVKYSLHFNKLPLRVVEEFCSEFDIDEVFYKEFLEAYKTTIMFQFDHLETIVKEHINNKDMEFKKLIEVLNIEGLIGEKRLKFRDMYRKDSDAKLTLTELSDSRPTLDQIESGRVFYVDYDEETKEINSITNEEKINKRRKYTEISKHNITKLLDDYAIFEKDGVVLEFNIVKE